MDGKIEEEEERVMGFEPTTYTLATCRSSQLSYTREDDFENLFRLTIRWNPSFEDFRESDKSYSCTV